MSVEYRNWEIVLPPGTGTYCVNALLPSGGAFVELYRK